LFRALPFVCTVYSIQYIDQPQGLAALNGLSSYIRHAIQNPNFSAAMEQLKLNGGGSGDGDDGAIILESVHSVATQIPREGHDVVGIGTYTDARRGWTELAKEYANARGGEMVVEGEAQLYQKVGAVFINIEYIGEENPGYWKDAGGAMARFFFL